MAITGEVKKNTPVRAAQRGTRLLALVYGELRSSLGAEFSAEQVLLAAQEIIDLWFHFEEEKDDIFPSKPSYHSDDVVTAFQKRTWEILSREPYDESIEDDRFDREAKVRRVIKYISEGS